MNSKPFISSISFTNGEKVELAPEQVVALVGSNNSGKTHFLKQLQSHLHGVPKYEVELDSGVIHQITYSWTGDVDKSREVLASKAKAFLTAVSDGQYRHPEGSIYPKMGIVSEQELNTFPASGQSLSVFADLFVEFDDAVQRISETELQQLVRSSAFNKESLTQVSRTNPAGSKLIFHYFKQIFHQEISYYDAGRGDLGFLLAPELKNSSGFGSAISRETSSHMENSPKMWLQGLGMRSTLGLLLKIFGGDKDIILVDEPEAFLHPPQAHALGNALSEISDKYSKQLFVATHDRNFLSGLTRNPDSNVSIQRLTRNQTNTICESIGQDVISDVREKSLIRYSPVLDTLFTKITILVENERDAYYYSEAIDHLLISNPDSYPELDVFEVLFLSTSGKGAIARTAELTRTLRGHVKIVCDLDLLVEKSTLDKVLIAVTGGKIPESINSAYTAWEEQMLEGESDPGKRSKKYKSKTALFRDRSSEEYRVLEALLTELDSIGVYLHPFGELEDFDRTLERQKGKSEWTHHAIQSGIHAKDESQDFAQRIMSDFKV